jgi:hypothetical protein
MSLDHLARVRPLALSTIQAPWRVRLAAASDQVRALASSFPPAHVLLREPGHLFRRQDLNVKESTERIADFAISMRRQGLVECKGSISMDAPQAARQPATPYGSYTSIGEWSAM